MSPRVRTDYGHYSGIALRAGPEEVRGYRSTLVHMQRELDALRAAVEAGEQRLRGERLRLIFGGRRDGDAR